MLNSAKQNTKRLLVLCALASLLLTPNFSTPAHACTGTSTGAGQCGG